MDRRSFIKKVSQALAGVFALALPSKTIGKKRSGTRLATDEEIREFKEEYPVILTTWSSMDGVGICGIEKGKWVNVVIQVTDFNNNQNISIV